MKKVRVMAKENFRETRIRGGYLSKELALAAKISPQAMGQIERRENGISPDKAKLLVEYIGMKFDDLFELVEREGA